MIVKSKTTEEELSQFSDALDASGYIALKFDFANDRIDWSTKSLPLPAQDDTIATNFPNHLTDFLKQVNPMDVPRLTEDLLMHEHEGYEGRRTVTSFFRYRMPDGRAFCLKIKGEIRCQEDGNKHFTGVLGCEDASAHISHQRDTNLISHTEKNKNGGHFVRAEPVRQLMMQKIELAMKDNEAALKDAKMPKGFLLVTGIDRFSLYNHAYGAQFVDSLLYDLEQKFSQILSHYNADIMRLGGDQYGFLFTQQDAHDMDHVARHILEQIRNIALVTLKGPIRMNFSMGGVSLTEKVGHAGDYIVMAEAALHASKQAGRGRFTSYSMEMVASPLDTRKLLKSADGFLHAYEEGRFRLAFQPVVDAISGKVSFYECLLRIIDENEKIIPAGAFMSKIEDFGLVHIADQFALHQAVEELERYTDIELSVNVSNASVNNPAWLRSAISLLRGKPHIAKRLIIEITETTVMRDVQKSKSVMNALRDLGCKIALDDFGAGYTSFYQMKEIKPDILKIDRSFVTDLHLQHNQIFVDAIQMLANGFNVETVGEGAETLLEASHLKERGVKNIQGFAFGHPSIKRLWLPKSLTRSEAV